jgi:uncharacterized membrane protein (UPF0127 family)
MFRFFLVLLTLTLSLFPCLAQAYDVTLATAAGARHVFHVERALSPEAQRKGLMFRRSLASDRGMLFVLTPPRMVRFWMKNTLIPLDLLFIRADGTVVGLAAEAKPRDETELPSPEPVAYVLEIRGGEAMRRGVAIGDKLFLPPKAQQPLEKSSRIP